MRVSKKKLQWSAVWACWLLSYPTTVLANESDRAWLADNLRVATDMSVRAIDTDGHLWSQSALGLDVHKVFSNERGDIGTLVFQPYLVRIDDAPFVPALFDDGHDQALQWRIANFNYTGIGRGRFNLRVGHFELPFGLEQVVQTNGTIYQMNATAHGLKADWGVSANGRLPGIEYEIAYMRGGGNDFGTDANGYVVARVGLRRENPWWIGLSGLDGEAETPASVVERRRIGVDVGWRLARGVTLMAEYVDGVEEAEDVRHTMTEIGWTSPRETTFLYAQLRRSEFSDRPTDALARRVSIGTRYEPSSRWSASFELRRDVDAADVTGVLQFRYRWQS